MTIYVGSDHRGFEVKNQLALWLRSEHQVTDCGANQYEGSDDWNDYANLVSKHILQEQQSIGILLCGSGVGVSIASNRHKGVRAALCFSPDQAKHARVNDHANIICLPSDYVDLKLAKSIIEAFIKSQPSMEEKYLRRVKKLDE